MHEPDIDAISLSPLDNVATVLRPIAGGERVRVRCGGDVTTVLAAEPVPLCHKISLTGLDAGMTVSKYGQSIGRALAAIPAGAHVHVHNMRSARAKVEAVGRSASHERAP